MGSHQPSMPIEHLDLAAMEMKIHSLTVNKLEPSAEQTMLTMHLLLNAVAAVLVSLIRLDLLGSSITLKLHDRHTSH